MEARRRAVCCATCAAIILALLPHAGCGTISGSVGEPQSTEREAASPGTDLERNVRYFQRNASLLASRIHELVNGERRKAGLDNLEWDPRLAAIALSHSRDMAERGYFDHLGLEGNDFADRYRENGYAVSTELPGRILLGGENLFKCSVVKSYFYDEAGGETSGYLFNNPDELAQAAVEGWMASAGHRENILTPYSREGIGVYVDAHGDVYVTENFS